MGCEQLMITPTDEIRDEILLWHNGLRSQFFENVPKTVFPSSTEVKKLCWDEELAEMAERWASQCEPVSDRCRKLPRFEVGQNIGIQIGQDQPLNSLQTFNEWARPMDPEFSTRNIESSRNRKSMERFFQLISVDTYLIGCAEATYRRSGFKHRLLVCNYGPAPKNDMTDVYSAAVALRKTRIMENRRMQLEEKKLKHLLLRHNVSTLAQLTRVWKNGDATMSSTLFTGSRSNQNFINDGVETNPKYVLKSAGQEESGDNSIPGDEKNYCHINCSGGYHIMCPSDEDQSSSCDVVRRVDDSLLKSCVINKLNALRNSVAEGLPSLPSASDMRILVWDEELAWLAGKWAVHCSKVPDSCRDVERFHVNQLVMVSTSSKIRDDSHCPILMNAVLRLTSVLDDNVIQSYSISETDFLRYLTQAIWSRSSRIGCAEVLFQPEPMNGMIALENEDRHKELFSSFVCNFGEGGNELNQKVFQPGAPCSLCPRGTSCTDTEYPNLCVGETQDTSTTRGPSYGNRRLEDGLESGSVELPFDYCNITCDGKQHVMCTPSEKPLSCNKVQIMDDSMLRKCVVSSLNDLRNKVAEGKFSSLPPASDMRMLMWDRELADLAARWATQCPDRKDECRDVARFPVYQVMLQYVSSERHDKSRCPYQMELLTNILQKLNPNVTENYEVPNGHRVSYVTQAIWSKTSRVGCAEVLFYQGWGLGDYEMPDDFDDHTSQHSSLICNFGEGGNVPNKRVYQTGSPCSQCPKGTACAGTRFPEYAPYPMLCVEETPS